MLGRALGAHSSINTFPELQIFERIIDKDDMDMSSDIDKNVLESMGANILKTIRYGLFGPGLSSEFLIEARELIQKNGITTPMALYRLILDVETAKAGKCIPCEQTPRYIFAANEILDAYSNAHIVHIYRDPRDVLLSQKNRWRRRFLSNKNIPYKRTFLAWSNYHPELTSRLWGAVMKQAQSVNNSPRFHEICYETLLLEPEATMRTLCKQIGISFESSLMNVSVEGSSSQPDRDTSSVGFDSSRIGSWKAGGLNKAEIDICERRVGKIMSSKGYDLSNIKSNIFGRLTLQCFLPLKVVCVLIMNYGRFQNLGKTIFRRFFLKVNSKNKR